jgi:hypothetical protein
LSRRASAKSWSTFNQSPVNTPSNNLQEMDDQRDVTYCKEQHDAQARSERSHVRPPSIRALETVKRACATFFV